LAVYERKGAVATTIKSSSIDKELSMIRNTFPNKGKTQPFQIKTHIFAIVSVGLCLALCGCGTATVSSQHEIGATNLKRDKMQN
jgi:hypothetical protein